MFEHPPFPLKSRLEVSLPAIGSNVDFIKDFLPKGTEILAILKSSAYGLNPKIISETLFEKGVTFIGVAATEEAWQLKEARIPQELFILNALEREYSWIIEAGAHLAISSEKGVSLLETTAKKLGKEGKVHLHIDTGMGRFGCRLEEGKALALKIHASPFLRLMGIMSHFPCADIPSKDPFSNEQILTLTQAIMEIEDVTGPVPYRHIANSAGALRFSLPQFNLARIGIALYGLYSSNNLKNVPQLEPAFRLKTTLVGINRLDTGETACYGNAFSAHEAGAKIGVIPLGYYHGFPTQFSKGAYASIHGKKAPYLDRVCMDQALVDISAIPEAKIGDSVEVFGTEISPELFSSWAGWIPHELITRVSPQVPVSYFSKEEVLLKN